MASILVQRLCQVIQNPQPGDNIAREDFCFGLKDILGGYHTVAQMKTAYNMDQDQQDDFDILVGLINSAPTLAKKLARIDRFNSILSKWERIEDLGYLSYDTPDDIQTWLLALDTGFL